MKDTVIKLVLVGAATGLILSSLGGCARKTASLAPADQAASGENKGGTESAAAQPPAPEASEADRVNSAALSGANEGAGPNEPLDTIPTNPGGLSAQNQTGNVEGSRTSLGVLPIYFDFDKSLIRPDQVARIQANALYLKNNPAIKARIEGNCDERGTYVYNLALGEYRAVGAKKYLVNLGVEDERLTTLSYGEEKPVNPGQDETAWAQNRRDDLVIVR